MIAWWCPCGAHGVERCVPASARALTAHLLVNGQCYGEYFYGCSAQRTTVAVVRDDSDGGDDEGDLRHELLPP